MARARIPAIVQQVIDPRHEARGRRIGNLRQHLGGFLRVLLGDMCEQCAHEVAFRREVVLQVAQAHADLVGDVAQRELLVAFVREHGLRGDDDVHLARLAF